MANVNIVPLFDNVLIKPMKGEDVLPSGIVLPDSAKEKPQMGVVMAVGPGRIDKHGQKIQMTLKVGDKVLYKKWGGQEVKVQGEEWMIVEEKEVLATVK